MHGPLKLMHEPAEGLDQYEPMDEEEGTRVTSSTSTQESSSPSPDTHGDETLPSRRPGGLNKLLEELGLAAVLCYWAWLLAL